MSHTLPGSRLLLAALLVAAAPPSFALGLGEADPVSYTHLTLQTSDLV